MKFTKPPLTFEQQVAHLQARGMLGDAETMKRRLESVNYYRLSAYWHTYRANGGETFFPGTDFEVVWARYVFDRELRLLVMDALERFEIAVRTRLAYAHACAGGAFGYETDTGAIYAGRPGDRQRFFIQLEDALKKNSHETFVRHFETKYGDAHSYPPIWVTVEILTFGDVVRLFKGSSRAIQNQVADTFGTPARVMVSWLLALNVIRNLCAHHGRLWNRELGVKPMIPRNQAWQTPVVVPQDRVFAVLTILAHILHCIAPGSAWATRLRTLIDSNPHVPVRLMGFPENWRESTIWKAAWAAPQGEA